MRNPLCHLLTTCLLLLGTLMPIAAQAKLHELASIVNQAAQEIFSYDGLNRLTNQVLTTAPGTLRSVSYGYNALGNILSHSDVGNLASQINWVRSHLRNK